MPLHKNWWSEVGIRVFFWVAVFALFAVLTTASYVAYLEDLNSCRKLCPPPNTAIVEKDVCLCAHPPVPKAK